MPRNRDYSVTSFPGNGCGSRRSDHASYSKKRLHQYGDLRPQPQQDTVPMLLTDSSHWKQLIIQSPGYAQVKLLNDAREHWVFRVDTISHTATVFPYADTLRKSVLSLQAGAGLLVLEGRMQDDSVYFQFTKLDIQSFPLINRGFRWVSEYPYNR